MFAGRIADSDLEPTTDEDVERWFSNVIAPQGAAGGAVDVFMCLEEPLALSLSGDPSAWEPMGPPLVSWNFSATSQFTRWHDCAQRVASTRAAPYDWYILLRPDLQLFSPLAALSTLNASSVHTRARGAFGTDNLFSLTTDHFSEYFDHAGCGNHIPRDGVPRPLVIADDQLIVVPAVLWHAVTHVQQTWDSLEFAHCATWFPVSRVEPPYGSGIDSWPESDFSRALICSGASITPLRIAARIKRSRYPVSGCAVIPCAPISKACGSV